MNIYISVNVQDTFCQWSNWELIINKSLIIKEIHTVELQH